MIRPMIVFLIDTMDSNDLLMNAALTGNLSQAQEAIDKGADIGVIIEITAKKGHIEIVRLLMKKTKILDYALLEASSEGHFDIVKLLVEAGAGKHDRALTCASTIEIAKYMLSVGAKFYNGALVNGASLGNMEIVQLMLSLAADNYDEAMAAASHYGQISIIDLMLSLGAKDYNKSLYNAALGGQFHIVQYMLDLGARDFNSCVYGYCAQEIKDYINTCKQGKLKL